jgi:pimeloyl-ACP methyl ester carboxylesterase
MGRAIAGAIIEAMSTLPEPYPGRCQANGIEIHFLRTGGAKPPLVALHGLIGSGACLAPLARELAGTFDVILPDARGHGATSAPPSGYSYADLATDVAGLCEALELDAPVLLGHSMGGLTAAVVASRLAPALKALILVDPTFISPAWQQEVFESDLAAEHRRLLATAREELLAQARTRSPHRSEALLGHLVDARLATSPHAFAVLTPPNPDYQELVQALRVPTLLLIGDRGVVSLDTAHALQQLNPLLQVEVIPGGHGLPYDDPGRVGQAVLAFLQA